MKHVLKLEEAAMTLAALWLLSRYNAGLPVWAWALLFFAPDISMLGYLTGNRTGAFTYNLFHHKGIALLLALMGWWLQLELMTATGILLFAHAAFDRIWGYGLKYSTGFKQTHLGSL